MHMDANEITVLNFGYAHKSKEYFTAVKIKPVYIDIKKTYFIKK